VLLEADAAALCRAQMTVCQQDPNTACVFFPSRLCPWRLQGFVKDRPTLLDVSMAGPLWGTAASGSLMLVGLGLSAAGLGDVTIDSPALADSFITGLLGQFVLGEALVNPEVGRGGG
jgi:hypothetical protein